MAGSGLELSGDIRSHVAIRKEGLRVACRNDVELSIVIELTDGEQRPSVRRGTESQSPLELVTLGFRRAPAGQQPMSMLPRDAELASQVAHRKPLAPQ